MCVCVCVKVSLFVYVSVSVTCVCACLCLRPCLCASLCRWNRCQYLRKRAKSAERGEMLAELGADGMHAMFCVAVQDEPDYNHDFATVDFVLVRADGCLVRFHPSERYDTRHKDVKVGRFAHSPAEGGLCFMRWRAEQPPSPVVLALCDAAVPCAVVPALGDAAEDDAGAAAAAAAPRKAAQHAQAPAPSYSGYVVAAFQLPPKIVAAFELPPKPPPPKPSERHESQHPQDVVIESRPDSDVWLVTDTNSGVVWRRFEEEATQRAVLWEPVSRTAIWEDGAQYRTKTTRPRVASLSSGSCAEQGAPEDCTSACEGPSARPDTTHELTTYHDPTTGQEYLWNETTGSIAEWNDVWWLQCPDCKRFRKGDGEGPFRQICRACSVAETAIMLEMSISEESLRKSGQTLDELIEDVFQQRAYAAENDSSDEEQQP